MRPLFRFIGYSFAGLLAVVILALIGVYFLSGVRLKKNYVVKVDHAVLSSAPDAVERGHHLAASRGCMDCHGKDLGGAKIIEDPAMGRVYGPNLTRGPGGLPPSFGNEDWVRALRHGVAADGHPLFLMPSSEYAHLTEEELGYLLAYLKSVPPVDRARVPISVGPVARALLLAGKIKLSAEEIVKNPILPDKVVPGPTVAYGRYLAVACMGCHGPNFSGGKIAEGPPDWPPASNLTPHPQGALSHLSEEDFIKTLKTARRLDGTELNPVMPRSFGQFNDDELKALWRFLQTPPAVATGTR